MGMKATAYFANDPSVGIQAAYFTIEIPFFDQQQVDDYGKEELRKQIRDFYSELDGEFGCTQVFFEFETFD